LGPDVVPVAVRVRTGDALSENPVASPDDVLFGGDGNGGGGGGGSEVDATATLFDAGGDTSGGLFGNDDDEIDPTAGLF